jgi:hypothetical protein
LFLGGRLRVCRWVESQEIAAVGFGFRYQSLRWVIGSSRRRRNAEDVWFLSAPDEAGEVRFQFLAHGFLQFFLVWLVSVLCFSFQVTSTEHW